MFKALGTFATGRVTRWVVIVVWLVLGVLGYLQAESLSDRTRDDTTSFLPSGAESAAVAKALQQRFPSGETRLAVLAYRREGGLTPADRRAIAADLPEVAEVPLVPEGAGPIAPFGPGARPDLLARNGSVALVLLPLQAKDNKAVPESIEELRDIQDEGAPGGLESSVTGEAALQADVTSVFESADLKLLVATGVLVLVLLLMVYRSPIIALIPIVVVGLSYIITEGIIDTLASEAGMRVDSSSLSILAVLMFGAGTDYCLLLVARYSEDLRSTEEPGAALRSAVLRAGPAVLASAGTVIAALLVLLAAVIQSVRTLGPVNAIGVAVVVSASLTLLPAILSLVGRRGFWPSGKAIAYRPETAAVRVEATVIARRTPLPPSIAALRHERLADRNPTVAGKDTLWQRIGARVLERPKRVLIICVTGLCIGALGVLAFDDAADPVTALRGDVDSKVGFDLVRSGFPPGVAGPGTILVEREGGPLSGPDVEAARRVVGDTRGVTQVTPPTERSRDGRAAQFQFLLASDPYGDAAFDAVEGMRDALARLPAGLEASVGDSTAIQLDYKDGSIRDDFVVIPLVLFVIFLVLAALLRAIVAPLYLIATVLLSFLSILGITVFVFGVIGGQPGFDAQMPLFVFVFLVALGVDYNIFLMSRVREETLQHSTHDAMLRALVATGPVITQAGVILAGTFAILMTLPINVLFQVGFAVSVGVLVDTFIVRTLMVPALVQIVGDASWWPSKPGKDAPVVSGVFRRPPPLPPAYDERTVIGARRH